MGDRGAVEDAARVRERRVLAIAAVAMVVVVVGGGVGGGLVVSAIEGDGGGTLLDVTGWLILVALLAGVAILLTALVFAFVWWRRRRGSALFARSPLWELPDRRSRNALVKALRRGDPIAPDQHETARRVARDWIGRRGLIWLYLALVAIQGANAVVQPDPGRWFSAAAAVLFLLGAVYFWWLIHRMRLALGRLDPDAAARGG